VSGLGERGSRLRSVARSLSPAPAVPPFYVQSPEGEMRALGWYMRMTRRGEALYLGHSAASAEVFLLRLGEDSEKKPKRRSRK
jgi:hypothetical protein